MFDKRTNEQTDEFIDLTASKEYDLSNQALNAIQNLSENLEIFMLLEELFKQTDKQQLSIDQNIHTQIKLDHLEEQLTKALKDIEKLKDKVRENGNSH